MSAPAESPRRTAAATLPAAAVTPMIIPTPPLSRISPAASSPTSPSRAGRRPRIRDQASPAPMLPPNTARPTTTVSMPVSRVPPSQPTSPASPPDSIQAPTSPPVSWSGGAVLSRAAAASGPADAASEMSCVDHHDDGGQSQRRPRVGPNVEGCAVEDVAQAQRPQRDDSRRPWCADRRLRNAVARRWRVAGLPAVDRGRLGHGWRADRWVDRRWVARRRIGRIRPIGRIGRIRREDRIQSAGNRYRDSWAAVCSPGGAAVVVDQQAPLLGAAWSTAGKRCPHGIVAGTHGSILSGTRPFLNVPRPDA